MLQQVELPPLVLVVVGGRAAGGIEQDLAPPRAVEQADALGLAGAERVRQASRAGASGTSPRRRPGPAAATRASRAGRRPARTTGPPARRRTAARLRQVTRAGGVGLEGGRRQHAVQVAGMDAHEGRAARGRQLRAARELLHLRPLRLRPRAHARDAFAHEYEHGRPEVRRRGEERALAHLQVEVLQPQDARPPRDTAAGPATGGPGCRCRAERLAPDGLPAPPAPASNRYSHCSRRARGSDTVKACARRPSRPARPAPRGRPTISSVRPAEKCDSACCPSSARSSSLANRHRPR